MRRFDQVRYPRDEDLVWPDAGEPLHDDDRVNDGDLPRTIEDRFRLESVLGTGGFATTYGGTLLETGERIAVKALSLEHVDDWKSLELFEREAETLRSIDHPRIPEYIAFLPVEEERVGYLVQGYAPGTSIEEHLDDGRRFTPTEAREIARQLLEILDHLHQLQPPVVHRDVTPSNVILDGDTGEERVHLVDFGSVRDVAQPDGGSTIVGTFGYMAPEQLKGEASPVSDLYGLGMTLLHAMSGVAPTDMEAERLEVVYRPYLDVSAEFERFLDGLIAPAPEDRFDSAASALEHLSTPRAAAREPAAPDSDDIAELVRRNEKEAARRDRERLAKRRARRAELADAKSDDPTYAIIQSTGGPAFLEEMRRRLDDADGSAPDHASRQTTDDGLLLEISPPLWSRRPTVPEFHAEAFTLLSIGAVFLPFGCALLSPLVMGVILAGMLTYGLLAVVVLPRWRRRLLVYVTPAGHVGLYRGSVDASEPDAVGRATDLDIRLVPPGDDARWGRLTLDLDDFDYELRHVSAGDCRTIQSFIDQVKKLKGDAAHSSDQLVAH